MCILEYTNKLKSLWRVMGFWKRVCPCLWNRFYYWNVAKKNPMYLMYVLILSKHGFSQPKEGDERSILFPLQLNLWLRCSYCMFFGWPGLELWIPNPGDMWQLMVDFSLLWTSALGRSRRCYVSSSSECLRVPHRKQEGRGPGYITLCVTTSYDYGR